MTADKNNPWRISEFDHPDHGWKWTASEVRWIEERIAAVAEEIARKHEKLADDVERCYRMLLSEPNTKGALFKAENNVGAKRAEGASPRSA